MVGTAQERLCPPYDRMSSRRLGLEMAEHEVARLVVHFGLEGELVLQRDCPRRSRSCRYLVDQPLYIGKFGVDLFAEHEWREPRPTPERHIDDRGGIADHVAAVGQV